MADKKQTKNIEKEETEVIEPEVVETPPPEEKPTHQPKARLALLEDENKVLKEQAARAIADYQNLERRVRDDKAKTIEFAREEIFESLLQPLEHLDLAAKTLKDQGLDMVVKQFWETLGEQGLSRIEPTGQKFDVEQMEAIEKVGEGDTVMETVSVGFRLGERVIRPAKVKVG